MARAVWCPTCGKVVPVLTKRQLDVLRLIAQGKSAVQIGHQLHLRPKTVKNYTTQLYQDIGVSSRVEATLYAVSNGIVKPKKAHLHIAD